MIFITTFCLTGAFIDYNDNASEVLSSAEESLLDKQGINSDKGPKNLVLATVIFTTILIIGIL